jgi:hypothetical protein
MTLHLHSHMRWACVQVVNWRRDERAYMVVVVAMAMAMAEAKDNADEENLPLPLLRRRSR